MTSLVPIQSLTVGAIREALRRALEDEAGAHAAVVAFVARIEWSPAAGEVDRGVRRLLAELEALTTLVEDGDVDATWFVAAVAGVAAREG
jgi:hypothetical protein